MKAVELQNLGLKKTTVPIAQAACAAAAEAGLDKKAVRALIIATVENPESHADHPYSGAFARHLLDLGKPPPPALRTDGPVPHRVWGQDIDDQAKAQMRTACLLPVAAAGALMPDAHVGYGLPIGGVLATRGVVIPYAVGVDIACRMKLTVLDLPAGAIDDKRLRSQLIDALESDTYFGVGAKARTNYDHDVMDDDWSVSPVTQRFKDKAWGQLGTSGSGNHFVEWGTLTVFESLRRADAPDTATENVARPFTASADMHHGSGWRFDLPAGTYLALLSHSGSRGTGAAVCDHYSGIARSLHPELPKEASHLAWLDLDSQVGQEYWQAMNLMGRYASANHACIHAAIAKRLGAKVVASVENHHNFAWEETHDLGNGPERLVVHRKGATPAGAGVLGVIPGSMSTPGYVVAGLGVGDSLLSASHGAGRAMSRTKARETYRWSAVRPKLLNAGVELLSAGIDENPCVYKDIHAVMAAQADLVGLVARFDPRIVKMAPEGEKAED